MKTWKQIQNKKRQDRMGYEIKWISITLIAITLIATGQSLFLPL